MMIDDAIPLPAPLLKTVLVRDGHVAVCPPTTWRHQEDGGDQRGFLSSAHCPALRV